MYNTIEQLIKHQGWARGSKIHYLILKKKHYRSSVSYRELFNTALGKVNKRTAGLLTSIKQELTKISLIQPKFSIQPIESIGDNVKKLVKVLKQKITKLIPKLKSVMSANKDLRKLI